MTFDNAIETMRKVITPGCYDNYSWCERYDNCEKCILGALAEIQSAHDEEINHARKVEYHRGYNDGRKSVNPDEWQLEQHRRYVADRLRKYRDAPPVQTLETGDGDAIEIDAYTFGGILSAVMYPVTEFPTSMLIDKLIYLLAGEMPEGADSAIYGNRGKAEVCTKTTASNLQKSPDLTSCHELGKLLKKTLGEAKCIHNRLKDQSKSHADLKDENQRLRGECRMYRTMLNDAAEDYKRECDKLRRNVERFILYGSKDYMELPKDVDGKHIKIGAMVYVSGYVNPYKVIGIGEHSIFAWSHDGNAYVSYVSNSCTYVEPDPIEEAFREYELGNLTSSEAIERIREVTNDS